MSYDDLRHRVAAYYAGKLAEHGPVAQGVDWNSAESQAVRFDQLLRIIDQAEPVLINDYGCGYGALLDHLRALSIPFHYCGFDVADSMIDRARERHTRVRDASWVISSRELPIADYTVASGIFNVRFDVADAEWLDYVLATIRELAALSRRGFAFNLLTRHCDRHRMRSDLYYADPALFLDHCLATYSRRVSLLHDYGLYEFTLLVRSDGGAAWQTS